MCVWWNKCTDSVTEKHKFENEYTQIWQQKNTCAMNRIHVFNNVEMRFGLCKNTGTINRSPTPGGMFVGVLRIVRHIIIIYVTRHRKPSATCLFRDGYAFWKQKPPFCTPKTILLHTKNPLFARQKGGFCSVKKAGLHNKNEQPEKPLPVATMPNTHTPPHNNTTHSAHAYA